MLKVIDFHIVRIQRPIFEYTKRKMGNHRMPESLRALLRIVSLTAANTKRMFDVSVACVKLGSICQQLITWGNTSICLLRIQVEVRSIYLIEPPEQILGRLVDIVAS